MEDDGCSCCIAGHEGDRLCRMCLMVWYNSGITEAPKLAREARWRKARASWPWGKVPVTVVELEELKTQPLPEVV